MEEPQTINSLLQPERSLLTYLTRDNHKRTALTRFVLDYYDSCLSLWDDDHSSIPPVRRLSGSYFIALGHLIHRHLNCWWDPCLHTHCSHGLLFKFSRDLGYELRSIWWPEFQCRLQSIDSRGYTFLSRNYPQLWDLEIITPCPPMRHWRPDLLPSIPGQLIRSLENKLGEVRLAELRTCLSELEENFWPLQGSHPLARFVSEEYLDHPHILPPRRNSDDESVAMGSAISIETFCTAQTGRSTSSYRSAVSGGESNTKGIPKALQEHDEYSKILKSKQLWPVDPNVERDWSGRGQHAEFASTRVERQLLSTILEVGARLGIAKNTVVESVRCKRILLARKTIQCDERFTKQKAIDEVVHLTRLEHSHIIQVIGTYVMAKELSILLYPVAEYNLHTFIQSLDPSEPEWYDKVNALAKFFSYLSNAMSYIHKTVTKHMDIKPQNILVRNMRDNTSLFYSFSYKVYFADFGIARSYENVDNSETEGPTMFTKKYAAPEVVDRRTRGLSADIFSLGCVFVEMAIALADYNHLRALAPGTGNNASEGLENVSRVTQSRIGDLDEVLRSNENCDTSYQANIRPVCELLSTLRFEGVVAKLKVRSIVRRAVIHIPGMLIEDPKVRPSAHVVAEFLNYGYWCCGTGRDALEAATDT